jgi:hypothetical protein
MSAPRIAFCTTVKGRCEHLRKTLPKNLADNADYDNCVFVVLAYSSDHEVHEYLKTRHAADILSGCLVVYSYEDGGAPYNVALSKNLAARCGIREGAEILCTVDADNFCGVGFASFIAESFREPGIVPGIFMCPDYQLIKSLPHGALRPARGYAGRLALWSQTFLKMGGYDNSFSTWRGEDIDINYRLQRSGYQMRHIPNCYLRAINHSAEMRFKEYPHAQVYESKQEAENIKARTETVVNYGNFGIGTVRRNFSGKPIELGPVPTRIFGIGLQKTATTSLHKALTILGFDSFHWGVGESQRIWLEMNALGRSPTLEQWYALSDLPIPLLYKKLDQSYPGSKFILTVRNEVDWLLSVSRLWQAKYNPTRHLWDVYPWSNQIHAALYGQSNFDALVFLQRYRRHNAEVREYFKDRPDDLLVMDMDDGAGWGPLCAFLAKPVPDVSYPRANVSSNAIGQFVTI